MFDTVNDRSGAQGTFILPLMPEPDVLGLSQADRQQVQGVYPGILPDVGGTGFLFWLLHHHYHDKE